MAQIGTDSETGVANAFEGTFHVDALAVLAHSAGGTFVHVHTEGVISQRSET